MSHTTHISVPLPGSLLLHSGRRSLHPLSRARHLLPARRHPARDQPGRPSLVAGLQGRGVDPDPGRPHSEVRKIYWMREEEEMAVFLSRKVPTCFTIISKSPLYLPPLGLYESFPEEIVLAWPCSSTGWTSSHRRGCRRRESSSKCLPGGEDPSSQLRNFLRHETKKILII